MEKVEMTNRRKYKENTSVNCANWHLDKDTEGSLLHAETKVQQQQLNRRFQQLVHAQTKALKRNFIRSGGETRNC